MIWGALLPLLGVVIGGVTTTPTTTTATSINDIESYVKNLEYEAYGGDISHNGGRGEVVINLNLLPDEVLAEDIDQGVQEDFQVVDAEQGDTTLDKAAELANKTRSRQLSLIYQGVYAPDSRFNAFVDGVMVNMVAEMKRKRMDPLYFRVYDRGIVEHVSARAGREEAPTPSPADSLADLSPPTESETTKSSRTGRQRGSAIGGGVIRGLTNVKRFGNAEVQIAGNTTLVRGHWLTGPLDLIIDYRATPTTITRVRTGLQAVQFDTLTIIDRFGAEMSAFHVISPLFDYMPYYGNRTLAQQHTTELVVKHLFSNASFMSLLLRDCFEVASYDKIIPQFGADTNYYSVIKYLFNGKPDINGPGNRKPGISIPGVPEDVAAFLQRSAKTDPIQPVSNSHTTS